MGAVSTLPYNVAIPITKSDTVNYDGTTFNAASLTKAIPAEAILVGDAGVVVGVLETGKTFQLTAIAGQIIPLKTIRVNSTTTSATNMFALYTA